MIMYCSDDTFQTVNYTERSLAGKLYVKNLAFLIFGALIFAVFFIIKLVSHLISRIRNHIFINCIGVIYIVASNILQIYLYTICEIVGMLQNLVGKGIWLLQVGKLIIFHLCIQDNILYQHHQQKVLVNKKSLHCILLQYYLWQERMHSLYSTF